MTKQHAIQDVEDLIWKLRRYDDNTPILVLGDSGPVPASMIEATDAGLVIKADDQPRGALAQALVAAWKTTPLEIDQTIAPYIVDIPGEGCKAKPDIQDLTVTFKGISHTAGRALMDALRSEHARLMRPDHV